ncbi:hypothetical protein [Thiothrix unzii]|uniref:hypothetical protein n=1 Tax=Thiothrix unzii TaxID=111769 RepID=UPI002A362B0D|nr:hypothetical protein [Thiothrix unzii]MDX9988193.1 hypothetical protein [Thiothrix unzii]
MSKRKLIKGEKHHWWPKGLSKNWGNERGLVHRIDWSGKEVTSKPKEFGQISDGHNILFDVDTPWNSTIEHFFDEPDKKFPKIVRWLESIKRDCKDINASEISLSTDQIEDNNFDVTRECLISLIVRSPKYRNAQAAFVEHYRGELDKKERKLLIAANINQKYNMLVQHSKGAGKLGLLFSNDYEFIFGDGFYTNVGASTQSLFGVKALIPLTPNIAVIWSSPMTYSTYPRLMSMQVDREIVELVNYSVQVYSKEYLFYRTQKPNLATEFKRCEHLVFNGTDNPVTKLINSLIPDLSEKRVFI